MRRILNTLQKLSSTHINNRSLMAINTPELAGDRYYLDHLKKTNAVIQSPYSLLGGHHRHLNKFIANHVLALPVGSTILDGGCGLSIWVTDEIRKNYALHNIDCEAQSIDFCRRYYSDDRYRVGDLYALPFPDDSFDAITIREVIEHIREPERALLEMKRVLKVGGRIILTTPNYSSPLLFLVENIYNRFFSDMKPYRDDVHPSKFRFYELQELLKKHFTLIEYGTIDFDINLKALAQKT